MVPSHHELRVPPKTKSEFSAGSYLDLPASFFNLLQAKSTLA